MGGYQVGSPASDPTAGTIGGVYFGLNGQSPIVDKSPYIYNVTTFGNGATGALVDGSLHGSGNRSMLVPHSYSVSIVTDWVSGRKIMLTQKSFLDLLITVRLVIQQLVVLRLDH